MKRSGMEVREQKIWLLCILPLLLLSFGMCFCGDLFWGICNRAPGWVLNFQIPQGVPHLQAQLSKYHLVWWEVWYSHSSASFSWAPSQVCWCFQVHLAWNLYLFWIYLWYNRKMVSYCSKQLNYRKSLKHYTFLKTPILFELVGSAFTSFYNVTSSRQ